MPLKYEAKSEYEEYCVFTPGSGTLTINFGSPTIENCWTGTGAPASPTASYQSLQIQIPSAYLDGSFNFCVTDVTAIVE